MEILSVNNLCFAYPNCMQNCLDDISFSIKRGDFVVLGGASGCGKTTLLKLLKPQLSPFGEKSGEICFCGSNISTLSDATTAFDIGFVMQNPDAQIVSDKVFDELAFGLLNMGLDSSSINRRICETAEFLGISDLFYCDVSDLSGGQKQLVALAGVIAMNPKLIILDEPTSQLDPISSTHFLNAVLRLNRELGTTVIIAEQRLNELWPMADKIMLMESGKLSLCEPPEKAVQVVRQKYRGNSIFKMLPCTVRMFCELDVDDDCPLSIRDGISFLESHFKNDIKSLERDRYEHSENAFLELKDVFVRYEKGLPDVLNGTTLKAFEGELLCVLGSNGAGKSTMLKTCAGLLKSHSGKVKVNSKKLFEYSGNALYDFVALLPQNPREIFVCQTVFEDLLQVKLKRGLADREFDSMIEDVCKMLDIESLLSMHPYDLSGGQLQRAALAKLLLLKPKLLLLDEPVKGLDACAKLALAEVFKALKNKGMCIVIVTHDVEFASICADRCLMFWGGKVVADDVPYKFFSDNRFYTTTASRISRSLFEEAVTCDEVVNLCKRNGVV